MPTPIKSLFLFLSLICFFYSVLLIWQRQSPLTKPPEIQTESNPIYPQQILFPSQGLTLPIIPIDKEGKYLPTISNGVAFLKSSSLPGEPGISLFYGHNWLNLLGKLKQTKTGQKITIKYSESKQYQYSVDQVTIVNPDDHNLPQNDSSSRLIIYTCAGIFDEKRLLVSATISSNPN
jgi:LPXTG-site transpeptidase (sortase) family protein